MNIHVVDENNKIIDRSRDLNELRERYRGHVQATLQEAGEDLEKVGLTTWDFGELEESCVLKKGGVEMRAFPALVVEKAEISLRLLDNPVEAKLHSKKGITRLLVKKLNHTVKYLNKSLLKNKDIGLTQVALGSRDQVVNDIIECSVAYTCLNQVDLPKNDKEFLQLADRGGPDLVDTAQAVERLLLNILDIIIEIRKVMKSNKNALVLALCFSDIKQQLDALLYPGFLFSTPYDWLQQYPRYLKAILLRLEKAPQNTQKDKITTRGISEHWKKHSDRLAKEGEAVYFSNEDWQRYRWMIEELRVSLFAQTLKTRTPVSDKRLNKLWQESESR